MGHANLYHRVITTMKRNRARLKRELIGRERGNVRWLMESLSEEVAFVQRPV